jgi:CBS domain-containing protein
VVSRIAIDEAMHEGRTDAPVASIAQEARLVAATDDLVVDVVQQMQLRGVDRCPVVDGHATRRVTGFLSPSDILRARMRESGAADEAFELFE